MKSKDNTCWQIYVSYHAYEYQIRGATDKGAHYAGYHPETNHRYVI